MNDHELDQPDRAGQPVRRRRRSGSLPADGAESELLEDIMTTTAPTPELPPEPPRARTGSSSSPPLPRSR